MKFHKGQIRSVTIKRFLSFSVGLVFVCSVNAQLPDTCKAPAELTSAIHTSPSAAVYDAAGAWFAEHNNLRCALASFNKAVQVQPGSAEAHYNLGLAQVSLKHIAEAENQFRLALKFDPNMSQAHTSLGFLLLDSDKAIAAEAEFRAALKEAPASVSALDHLGVALAAQRRYTAAIGYWNQALALQPDSPDLLLSIATSTYKAGDTKGALAMLTSLIASHSEFEDAHFTLANIYAQETRFGEAATEYGEVLRLNPRNTVALLSRAKALSSSGSYQEAAAPAEQYVSQKPSDPEGHLVLGTIYKTLGDYDKAEKELIVTCATQPDNAQAQYELGFVFAHNEKTQQALPHLERAYALKPSDTATQFQLAAALRKLGNGKRASEITEIFKVDKEKERQQSQLTVNGGAANAYLLAGEPARAAEVYRQMLRLDPGSARTQYNLALALAASADGRGGREALESAIELDPKMAVAHAELGLMDVTNGNLIQGKKRLETALAIDPQLAAAQGNLGLVYALQGDNTTAEGMFRKSIEDDPNYVQGYLNLGLTLASQQKLGEAEVELQKALSLAPENPKVISILGKVKARAGKSDEAITLLRKYVEVSKGSVESHLDLAIALADSYDLAGALSEADAAIAKDPRSSTAQFNRGRILIDLARPAEAKSALEVACRLAPAMTEPHYYLALADKQTGDYKAAAELLEGVVRSQPENVMAWNFLGQALHEESKDNDAIAAWRKAIAIDPRYTPSLYSLTRALLPIDRAESERIGIQLKAVLTEEHIVDEAATVANNAIASMRAHDWPEAVKGFKDAIQICGECSTKAELHKSLGLIYCNSGDIDNGERELRLAKSLKGPDPGIDRALSLIAGARAQQGLDGTKERTAIK